MSAAGADVVRSSVVRSSPPLRLWQGVTDEGSALFDIENVARHLAETLVG
jgi:hypothetical protein